MNTSFKTLLLALLLFSSCQSPQSSEPPTALVKSNHRLELEKLQSIFIQAFLRQDFDAISDYYRKNTRLMTDFQPTLEGKDPIKTYYREQWQSKPLKAYQKVMEEVFDLGTLVLELGSFTKIRNPGDTLRGEYWNIWENPQPGIYLLITEAYGYNHPIEDPTQFLLSEQLQGDQAEPLTTPNDREEPFELRAYNALMEKAVRERDGLTRTDFFTPDGVFYPFAEAPKRGLEELKPYLLAYNQGPVVIDSIRVWAYDYQYINQGILEYSKFYVEWRIPDFAGKTQGKGIRYWQRQEDQSLRIHREIGLHNYLE